MSLAEILPKQAISLGSLKLLTLCIVAYYICGLYGVLSLAGLFLLIYLDLRFGLSVDSAHNHGIASDRSSRLGGIYVWLAPMGLAILTSIGGIDANYLFPLSMGDWALIMLPSGLLLMGLLEDFTASITPKVRLVIMFFLVVWFLQANARFIPDSLGTPIFDWILDIPVLAVTVLIVCIVGVVNAFNTSDGANGLVSGTGLLIALVCSWLMPQSEAWQLIVATWLIFFLVNITTGKIFLGDGGSYYIGAVVAVGMLRLFNSADVSFILILALVFYPVMDFLMALIRRLKNRTPLMEPDSEHFHNLLYAFYKKQSDNPVLANSLTGVTIVAIWPGIPVAMIYLGVAPAGQAWNYLFMADFIIFLSLYPLLRGAASNNG